MGYRQGEWFWALVVEGLASRKGKVTWASGRYVDSGGVGEEGLRVTRDEEALGTLSEPPQNLEPPVLRGSIPL